MEGPSVDGGFVFAGPAHDVRLRRLDRHVRVRGGFLSRVRRGSGRVETFLG